MSKARSNFRKNDAKRLISAAECAGLKIGRVEVDRDGKIAIFPIDDRPANSEAPSISGPSEIVL